MQSTHRGAPPANPAQICFCCAGNFLAGPWNDVPYEERQRFTFIPRYTNPRLSHRSVRYCPKCEAQRCENMPGRNHYHMYRYVPLPRGSPVNLQFIQIGRVINTIGVYRESFQHVYDSEKPNPNATGGTTTPACT